jgi:hypothetical protein
MAFRNRRDLTFEDSGKLWGFDQSGFAHGMAFGDLDNDGDLDVVINVLNGPARMLRNGSPAPRLAVRLKGARGNTAGIGARLKVTGGPVTQTQEMISGGRYLSGDQALRVFAAGAGRSLEVEVLWRNGRRSVVRGLEANQIIEIEERDTLDPLPPTPAPQPLFESLVTDPDPVPSEPDASEITRQPLLPRRLGTEAPGVAWVDWDADGDPDLLISADEEGRFRALRNDGPAGFVPEPGALGSVAVSNAVAVLVDRRRDSPTRLIAGISNEKAALARAPRFHSWTVQAGKPIVATNAPADEATTGPMALADVDGDGQLDLLVGARARAGRYPETSRTVILPGRTDGWGEAQLVTDQVRASGAVFTDTDGDGDPDLVLAGDWDTLRFFRNDGGRWVDATAESGLGAWRGLWNGVNAGDFDGDGRLDLVASNWGRNWRTDQPGASNAPIQMVYGEFHEPGRVLTLMASWDPHSGRQTPWRSWSSLSQAIPALTERAHSHREFAVLSVDSLLGPLANRGRTLNAETFDSMVFLNRGGRFEGVPLAVEAQFSPSFGISIADFDGDGCEDLFLSQNFFGMDVETSRQDAGAGLVLLGDGRGHFRSLGPREAGFSLAGEQRGSAVADVDADGRPDLAVGQQSGKTRILRNRAGKPGVRVALEGPAGNPDGIGAAVRLVMGSRLGPVREIHAGAGFRSQDSPEILLATPQDPTAVEVRWPGGKVQRSEWPVGARSMVIRAEGLRQR